jgi:nucleoside-diphosphate-sugar epimerase
MKIFLTGATGFLGSHVVDVLLERGHQLKALVRPTSSIRRLKELGVDLVPGQIPQNISLSKALSDCDAVVHIAGIIKALSQKEFFRINTQGTQYLVEQILKANSRPRLLIHVSSIAAVDPRRRDDYCQPADRDPALSDYGESKRRAELALAPLKGKVQTCILRPPPLYGPQDHEFLPLFRAIDRGLAPMYRGGKNQLSICYGSDTARAVADLVDKPPARDGIYCLDDGKVHSWRDIVEAAAKAMKKRPRYFTIPDPAMYVAALFSQLWAQLWRKPAYLSINRMRDIRQPRWVCGYKNLQAAVGWEPSTSLESGMNNTYQFYRKEGWIH